MWILIDKIPWKALNIWIVYNYYRLASEFKRQTVCTFSTCWKRRCCSVLSHFHRRAIFDSVTADTRNSIWSHYSPVISFFPDSWSLFPSFCSPVISSPLCEEQEILFSIFPSSNFFVLSLITNFSVNWKYTSFYTFKSKFLPSCNLILYSSWASMANQDSVSSAVSFSVTTYKEFDSTHRNTC